MDSSRHDAEDAVIFRSPVGAVLVSLIFLAACLIVVYLCVVGLLSASGVYLILLISTSAFPILMLVTAVLRALAICSRRIRLSREMLDHRQVFKNYRVRLDDITRIETRKDEDGDVDTVKILWSGTPFYIDAAAIDGFDELVALLVRRATRAEVREVEEFSSSAA